MTSVSAKTVQPLTHAAEFAARTRDIGATMRTANGSVVGDGEPGYMVGGHPARAGGRVPTAITHTDVDQDMVSSQFDRVMALAAPNPRLAMGSWNTGDKVEWDASTIFNDRRTAIKHGQARNQQAIWDNARGREIPTGGDGR